MYRRRIITINIAKGDKFQKLFYQNHNAIIHVFQLTKLTKIQQNILSENIIQK